MPELHDYKDLLEKHGLRGADNCSFRKLDKPVAESLKGCLTYAMNAKDLEKAVKSSAAIIVIDRKSGLAIDGAIGQGAQVLVVEKAIDFFYELHLSLKSSDDPILSSEQRTSTFGVNCDIHSTAFIDDTGVDIGNNVVIGPYTIVLSGTSIDDNVRIRSRVTIGEDCLEVKTLKNKKMIVPHRGRVRIGANSEIQSGTTISKGLFLGDETLIEREVFIADLCHIAHGAQIGSGTIIAAGSNICGYAVVGLEVWVGPGCTVSNRVKIGQGARLDIGSVVIRNVKDREEVSSIYASNHRVMMRQNAKNQIESLKLK